MEVTILACEKMVKTRYNVSSLLMKIVISVFIVVYVEMQNNKELMYFTLKLTQHTNKLK